MKRFSLALLFSLLIGAASAQLNGGLMFPGPGTPATSGGGAKVLTFNNAFEDNTGGGQTVTATSLALGSSSLTLIACGVADGGSAGLTGVSFGAQALTQVTGSPTTSANGVAGCFFFFFVSPGTANLVMTFTSAQFSAKEMFVWTATNLTTGNIGYAGAQRSGNVGGAANITNAVGDFIVSVGRNSPGTAGKPAWTIGNGSSQTLTQHSTISSSYEGGDVTSTTATTFVLQDTSTPDGVWGGASFR